MHATHDIGTHAWTRRTGGRLDPAERGRLVRDLPGVHATNLLGRAARAVHLDSGRRAHVAPERLVPPETPLTRAAAVAAARVLPATLLNHGHRTYVFGRALGELEGIDVDAELLFAAALLHDTGLPVGNGAADFTLASSRLAQEVADEVGLSTTATETLKTAITMHHSPRVRREAGAVAYLTAAGAGVDVVGLRSWELPAGVLADAVARHPREAFKWYFTRVWAQEAARVPQGRARLLRRYGAFSAAIALAPFEE
jgi:hypothetical protein